MNPSFFDFWLFDLDSLVTDLTFNNSAPNETISIKEYDENIPNEEDTVSVLC